MIENTATQPRVEELTGLIEVAREQLKDARRLGLRSLAKSIRYDLRRWNTELADLEGKGC